MSLVEVLVVIVIVVILIAILIPTVATARRSAKTTACASNLRQIGQAIIAYRSEQRRMPEACDMPPPFRPNLFSAMPSVAEALASHLPPSSAVYRCPADERAYYACKSASPFGRGISYEYFNADKYLPDQPQFKDAKRGILSDVLTDTNRVRLKVDTHGRRGGNVLYYDGSVSFFSAQD